MLHSQAEGGRVCSEYSSCTEQCLLQPGVSYTETSLAAAVTCSRFHSFSCCKSWFACSPAFSVWVIACTY